ncbi:MAG: Hsp20/alpha crystallin family protein [Bacteroidota bacterium]
MTLVRFKPTHAKDFFRDTMVPSQMMGLIDSFFNDSAAKFERNVFFTPRVDVLENAHAFEIHMALPGIKKEHVNIAVEGDKLTISGERKMKETSKDEKMHTVETYYGKFSRTFTLPENLNKSAIEAGMNDGVLSIILPKTEVKENKSTINIK